MLLRQTIKYYVFVLCYGATVMLSGCAKHDIKPIVNPPPVPTPPAPVMMPIDSADMIYIGAGYANDVYAINAQTGAVVWSKKVTGTYNTSAIYCNGKIIVKGLDENITAFDTAGNVQWTFLLPGNTESPNNVAIVAEDGVVFAEDLEHVYAIHIEDGTIKWTYTKETHYDTLFVYYPYGSGTLIPKGNRIYLHNSSSNLYVLDAETGVLQWETYDAADYTTPIVSDSLVFLPTHAGLRVQDGSTGALKSTLDHFPIGVINMKYGRIYDASGTVIDSATGTISYPSMQFGLSNGLPVFSVYPLLEDSLAIMPSGVADAMSGEFLCTPDVVPSDAFRGGVTYLNHILYYTTSQREEYNGYTAARYYSDVYAYNISTRKLLWHTAIENSNIFSTEPCVVTRAKHVYRGAFSFK